MLGQILHSQGNYAVDYAGLFNESDSRILKII